MVEATGRAWRATPVISWLIAENARIPDLVGLHGALCARLDSPGSAMCRSALVIRTLHPEVRGVTYLWRRGDPAVTRTERGYGIETTPTYQGSPFQHLFEVGTPLRRRLGRGETDMPLLRELAAEGVTDFYGIALPTGSPWVNAITWATDDPAGFLPEHIRQFNDLGVVLAPLVQVRAQRRIAEDLLFIYLGRNAAERLFDGRIRRGDGEVIRCVLWTTDLSDFTEFAERESPGEVISTLNAFFERMTDAVHDHGGDVLKFMGDGLFAIFPVAGGEPDSRQAREGEAAARALTAAEAAIAAVTALNDERRAAGRWALDYSLALHLGDVVFGNIGARQRLDFTVIGPAVNRASRIESLGHELDVRLLMSREFATLCGRTCVLLGHHRLRGIKAPQAIYTLASTSGPQTR